MHRLFLLASLSLLTLQMFAQSKKPAPILSDEPITSEQLAIYQTVLAAQAIAHAMSFENLNVSNVTRPFGLEEDPDCLQDIEAPQSQTPPVIHRMDPAVLLTPKMVFVDPQEQRKKMSQDRKSAGNLFVFSEIVFNKDHTRAAVQFNFPCGGLCGEGGTVIVVLKRGKWVVVENKYCSGWIS